MQLWSSILLLVTFYPNLVYVRISEHFIYFMTFRKMSKRSVFEEFIFWKIHKARSCCMVESFISVFGCNVLNWELVCNFVHVLLKPVDLTCPWSPLSLLVAQAFSVIESKPACLGRVLYVHSILWHYQTWVGFLACLKSH